MARRIAHSQVETGPQRAARAGLDALSVSALLRRLRAVQGRFGSAASAEKQALAVALAKRAIHQPQQLRQLHACLCFLRAFPDDGRVLRVARVGFDRCAHAIARLPARARRQLDDSGLAGTRVRHVFAYDNVRWLCERFPSDLAIDWPELVEPEHLDPLLWRIVSLSEQQTLDDGEVSAEEWIRAASRGAGVSDLTWLLRECRAARIEHTEQRHNYDRAEVTAIWSLRDGTGSKTHNALHMGKIAHRTGMRRLREPAAAHIARHLRGIERLDRRRARAVWNVVQAALLVRCREVHAMQHANLDEIYLAPLGAGVQLLVLGVKTEARLALEANYGYMIFANGLPIGYGGFTPLFHQANTGVNVFDEFRGSEASFLYAQVLRVAHTLFGCTRFIVNPYQFGEDNEEALASGAFWFYYRLGFRPVEPSNRELADAEYARVRAGRRSSQHRLERLASCDMHLLLPGAREEEHFPEAWLGLLARGATELIARQGVSHRPATQRALAAALLDRLRLRVRKRWSRAEHEALLGLAPTFAQIEHLERWSVRERRDLLALIRAKGACTERDFALRMCRHDRLRRALAAVCGNGKSSSGS